MLFFGHERDVRVRLWVTEDVHRIAAILDNTDVLWNKTVVLRGGVIDFAYIDIVLLLWT